MVEPSHRQRGSEAEIDLTVRRDTELDHLVNKLLPSRLLDVIESAPDGMLMTDDTGCIVMVNQQLEAMFGHDRADLVGQSVEVLLPERFHAGHLGHRHMFHSDPKRRAMGAGLDLLARRSDGSEFPVEVSLSPASAPQDQGHVIASIRDISDRAASAEQLHEAQLLFHGAFHDGPVPMALVEISPPADRLIIEANQAMADLLGYDRRDLLGMSFAELTHPEDRPSDDQAVVKFASGEIDSYAPTKRYLRSDGSLVWVQLHVSPLVRSDGSVLGIAHVIDISDQLEALSAEQRQESLQRAVSAVRLVMLRGASREEGLGLIARSAAECLDADVTVLLTPGLAEDSLEIAASFNLDAGALAALSFSQHSGVVGEVFQSGSALTCEPGDPRITAGNKAVIDGSPVESIVVTPMHGGVETVGILLVVRRAGAVHLDADELDSIEVFASEAVVAIELAAATEARGRLELLEDRERIGRDMHDNVIGRLFGTGMKIQAVASCLEDGPKDQVFAAVDEIDETIKEIRSTIYGIRSEIDWGKGVRGEILALVVAQRDALGFEPGADLDGPIDELATEVVEELLSTLREALLNAVKYAEATALNVYVRVVGGRLDLAVEDNGVGFNPAKLAGVERSPLTNHGLANMADRAAALGGRVEVISELGEGTSVLWTVPIHG